MVQESANPVSVLSRDWKKGFYAELIETHNGLSDADSDALNARLVLLLANHIGDREVLSEALRVARAAALQNAEPV